MGPGHENRDAKVGAIVWTLAGLAVGAAIACAVVYGIFWYLASHPLATAPPNPLAANERQIPPTPRIEVHPAMELDELHVYEDKLLETYGWTDKDKGIVRIPLDRAKELMLEKGFPTR